MSSKLEPAIWSQDTGDTGDTGDTLFWQVSVDHNVDVQYQICTVACSKPRLHVSVNLLAGVMMVDQRNALCSAWENGVMAVVLYNETNWWQSRYTDGYPNPGMFFCFYSIQPVFVWCLEEYQISLCCFILVIWGSFPDNQRGHWYWGYWSVGYQVHWSGRQEFCAVQLCQWTKQWNWTAAGTN